MKTTQHAGREAAGLKKCPTGVAGLDEILQGGLPRGRPTLVAGNAGSGKTLFAMELLARGAGDFGEPGVFMSFEESERELAVNMRSLGFDLPDLVSRKLIAVDQVIVERRQIEETGEYDLEGLFVRLDYAINSIKAKRVVLDTIEALFASFTNAGILRAELRRLFSWLKDRGVTAIVTGERGEGGLTRQGLEEYVSDCVILLDNRVTEQLATRRLRIVKYRGSSHGTKEFPFIIDEDGISVLPITSAGLDHAVTSERVLTGIRELDEMLGGRGLYRGSTILVSGGAGTGKTGVAAAFVDAACRRGESCLFFSFEEPSSQILRNMRSIGFDLEQHVKKGVLRFDCRRPTNYGLETHLAMMHKSVRAIEPRVVVVDPITDFEAMGSRLEIRGMLMRLVDFLKGRGITNMLVSLSEVQEQTAAGISSLVDTWLVVRNLERSGENIRGLYVLKSRGMAHSNQIREFKLTDQGLKLDEIVRTTTGEALVGAARTAELEGRRR